MESKEERRVLDKDYYWRLKSRGICVQCMREYAEPGKIHCAECADYFNKKSTEYLNKPGNKEKAAERQKARRERLIADGICIRCGKKPAYTHNGHTYRTCYLCHIKQLRADDRHAEKRKEKRNKGWKENGLCPKCGGVPVDGYKVCQTCLERLREMGAKGADISREKRKLEGHPWIKDETVRKAEIASQKAKSASKNLERSSPHPGS